jgi:hypothetical protein
MRKYMVPALVALASAAGSAMAQQNQVTFSYSDLSASFVNGGTMATRVFTAQAVSVANGLQTGGDVSRVDVTPNQTATFLTGFKGISAANVVVSMNIDTAFVVVNGNNTVQAAGGFTLTDDDNDIITGTLTGTWTDLGAGFDSFQGLISSASIIPQGGGDNQNFNGAGAVPLPNSFSYAGLQLTGLTGALVELQLTQGIFFNNNFSGVSSQVSGILVPAPGALGLLAAGGMLAARRRRR